MHRSHPTTKVLHAGSRQKVKAKAKAQGESSSTEIARPQLRQLLALLEGQWALLLIGAGGVAVSSAASSSLPQSIGRLVDLISSSCNESGVMKAAQLWSRCKLTACRVLQLLCLGSVATIIHKAVSEMVVHRVGSSLRKKLFAAIITQPQSFFDATPGGELASRLAADVHEVLLF